MSLSLIEAFSSIEDPRVERHKRHKLIDIIVLTTCAVVSGSDGWESIEEFGKNKPDWLQQWIELENGILSHDCIARVISKLQPTEMSQCFTEWVNSVVELTEGEIVAIDGKTAEKSNEITAIPALLELLEIKGCIITIDAMGCQASITEKIIEKKADYVLAVKDNQKFLNEAITDYFEEAIAANNPTLCQLTDHEEINAEHGRIEVRRCYLSTNIDTLPDSFRWKGFKSIGMVESERTVNGKTSIERRHYICSLTDVKSFARAARKHWGVENSLHWVLDVVFREDDLRIRTGYAPENFNIMRQLAINLLNKDTSRGSIKKKRFRAALSDDFRESVIFSS